MTPADRWIRGWTHLRGLETSQVDGSTLVQVNGRNRDTELICDDPGVEAFRTLLRHVAGDPRAMLTAIGHDLAAYRGLDLGDDVQIDRDDETLMTTLLDGPTTSPALPPTMTADLDTESSRTTYRLIDDGRVACEATMSVLDGWATFDAIETLPSHRRRGLGRHVVTVLARRASADGAHHGVLVATADGRGLYEALGWRVERELVSVVGSPGRPRHR